VCARKRVGSETSESLRVATKKERRRSYGGDGGEGTDEEDLKQISVAFTLFAFH